MRFINEIKWKLSQKERMQVLKLSPDTGKVSALADERGKCKQKQKKYFYGTVLNTCLSFLNEVKNPGSGYKY